MSTGGITLDVEVAGRLRADLTFGSGDTVAVVGPNGAGKSTLLHVVAGLVRATGGVRVDGEDWTHLPVQQRSIGMLFQDRLLFPHLSAVDNVAFGLRSRGVARREARTRAYAWLERVDLADLADRRPEALSGGQAQRVALARAMVTDPRVLLLDEPMGALDVGAAAGLRLELARRLREFSGVTLLVTHDAVDALTLASTVVVLDEGTVHQVGSPHEVATRPRTPHVARLVGLNVLRGVVAGDVVRLDGGGEVATAGAATSAAATGTGGTGGTGAAVLVAFSAASVALSPAEPVGSSVRNRWRGRVRGLTAQEARVRVVVDLDELAGTVIADVTTAAAADLGLAPGTPVWASVKATETTVYA